MSRSESELRGRRCLILQPVALGDGLPLFKDLAAPLRLELVDAQTYNTGVALYVYRAARPTS